MKAFLGFQSFSDDNYRTRAVEAVNERREKRLSRAADSVTGKHTTLFQAPSQFLHGGNVRNRIEDVRGQGSQRPLPQNRHLQEHEPESSCPILLPPDFNGYCLDPGKLGRVLEEPWISARQLGRCRSNATVQPIPR